MTTNANYSKIRDFRTSSWPFSAVIHDKFSPSQTRNKKNIRKELMFPFSSSFFFFLVAMNKALNSILDWLLEWNILVQKCTGELFSNYTPDMYI